MRDRLRAWWLPAAAFCAAFLPVTRSPAYFALATVPVYVQGVVVGLVAAAAARWVPRRHWPLFVVAAADAVVRSPGFLLAVTSCVAATAYRRPRQLIVYTVAASLLAVLPRPGVEVVSSLGGAPLFVWFPLIVGLWVATRAQVVAGLRERAERLVLEQAARAEQARAHERARIARDMHDVVAHRVSLMVLRAGALEINADDEKTAAEAELIRITGKEALTQLRAVLGVLEQGEQDASQPRLTLADLDWLIEQSRSVGVAVDRCDEGTLREVPATVGQTAYRIVQEALTNVHKHARTATTHVVLRYLPSTLQITVENTVPRDCAPAMPGSGLGLNGLRQRVETQGGRFTAGPEPDGGFLVSAEIPA
ncbi:signal transduction histidine kinase [Amycolatopsis bartoniae]|uniref:histidine kinase n=1 Tax=Amycolatopsis bartoniae TaxID=941986 RepID=A0A8H9IUV5_9PSEU|nr:histidine kinase [Amycolatopsis bartoniae]MBB2938089.1 signal transduction histidine kinase [Amycolatopsis bartoniae]TVT01248.1 two-component sensor histidine kinase [Amycolatopsis bartoniae]GHF32588.1 two-component sensor histidine kinase [Amycolatopsis bartoniae]